ncbi:hypothetical protein I350_05485 [Cryptococcus amylolentus CBS 6273]|uniref:Uncharacterized protein n=1 Tax=Cryptococcus amylolentus CBS 6273 TaxID=1296118 RepID=A0A1E3JVL0_9TREE|nr:hypothetical protein I350_05485 [Cryptococcus amylolentus CBS 6273]
MPIWMPYPDSALDLDDFADENMYRAQLTPYATKERRSFWLVPEEYVSLSTMTSCYQEFCEPLRNRAIDHPRNILDYYIQCWIIYFLGIPFDMDCDLDEY